ncbi:kelch-like protein 5 isoform X1 [Ceratitis capitata]|uniref:kelch-like protein 5 isoform X1 n=1 Tax=Ceratitis capitata TaxID=7213 RepID=UPI00032A00C0|nr:kelch-like protein 5 isoform X1 [Ceratitis capitata]
MASGIASSTPVRDGSNFATQLLGRIQQLYDEQKLVDVTFKAFNPTVLIPAHRLILSATSGYFQKLFSRDQDTSPIIEINEINSDTFERLIAFCYTGRTLITHENVAEMLKASVILQLDDAVADCMDYIFENITVYTLEWAYSLQRETQCEHLRQKIHEYEIRHFMEISNRAEFLSFDIEKLKRILESEELNITCEEDVFAAIKCWYEHDAVSRECHLSDLIGCLRLSQFDVNFIMTNIQPLPGCESLALKAIVWATQPMARAMISLKFKEPRNSLRSSLEETYTYLAVERSDNGGPKCLLRYNETSDEWLKYKEIDFKGVSFFEVILNDNNLIFIGGRRDQRVLNNVKSWNLRTKTWNQLPAMICPREGHCVALLDGKIYAIGGSNGNITLMSMEVLTSAGDWRFGRSMNTPRREAAVVTLNGNIFVMGGYDGNRYSNSVEQYNPNTNLWTSCASMNNYYWLHGAAVHKGCIFVVKGGGHNRAAERYDPQKNEWTEICALPNGGERTACISINNHLWAIGGFSNQLTDSTHVYDEETDRWLQKTPLPKAGYYSCFAELKALQ